MFKVEREISQVMYDALHEERFHVRLWRGPRGLRPPDWRIPALLCCVLLALGFFMVGHAFLAGFQGPLPISVAVVIGLLVITAVGCNKVCSFVEKRFKQWSIPIELRHPAREYGSGSFSAYLKDHPDQVAGAVREALRQIEVAREQREKDRAQVDRAMQAIDDMRQRLHALHEISAAARANNLYKKAS